MKKLLLISAMLIISCITYAQEFLEFKTAIKTTEETNGFTGFNLNPQNGGVIGDAYGASCANIGDVDGDGIDDIASGSPVYDGGAAPANNTNDRGAVFIHLMNRDGSVKSTQIIDQSTGGAALTLAAHDHFGRGVAGLGDLNGDGNIEIAVGTQFRNSVYIITLSKDGQYLSHFEINAPASANNTYFGYSVSPCSDFFGDGTNDIIIGAPESASNPGGSYIFSLSVDEDGDIILGKGIRVDPITPTQGAGDLYGIQVEGLGDLDGNGVDDIAVGALTHDEGAFANSGAFYILYLDADTNMSDTITVDSSIRIDQSIISELVANERFGRGISYGNDLNNDGIADFLVTGDGGTTVIGGVYAIYMNASGGVAGYDIVPFSCALENITAADVFGCDLDAIDYDNDGRTDYIIGAQYDNDQGTQVGAFYLLNFKPNCLSTNYTTLNNETISENQSWSGQYEINGTITIDNNAVIDVTNASIIFRECASINFTDGSRIVANNSVFQSCDNECDNYLWDGLSFTNSENNIINECTFNNANIPLDFGDGAFGKVINSSFRNFFSAINISSSETDFTGAITNNTFIIDNDRITSSSCLSSALYARGIAISGRSILQNISQNNFINSTDGDGFDYTGITAGNSSLNVTDNNFSNLYTSVLLTNTTAKTNVENNEIEITKGFVKDGVQISVITSSSYPVYIFGNTIRNAQRTVSLDADSDPSGAIYTYQSQSINIKNNSIIGFKAAIQLEESSNCQIVENQILNSNIYGIYTISSTSLLISCNEIDMDFGGNNTNVVRGIYCNEIDNGSTIHSNCIKDCHHSIYLYTATSTANNIPTVRNNFLYNYVIAGIYAHNYNGLIGNNTKAGMNAFYSNYATGADIFADGGTIDQNYNQAYSIPGTANGGSITSTYGSGYTFSTASCAFQHNGGSTKQTNLDLDDFTCDEFASMTLLVIKTDDKVYFDRSKYNEHAKASSNSLFSMGIALANSFNKVENSTEAKKTLDEILVSDKLTNNQKAWIKTTMHINLAEYESALISLSLITTQDIYEEDKVFVYTKLVEQRMGVTITETDLDKLYTIAVNKVGYSIIADEIIRTINPDYGKYNFKPVVLEKVDGLHSHVIFDQSQIYLTVYPNPASDQINLSYNIGKSPGGSIRIYSVTGQVVKTIALTKVSSTKLTIDLSELETGVYIVSVEAKDGSSKQSKFIKQ